VSFDPALMFSAWEKMLLDRYRVPR
jgi:hypothetical protein